MGSVRDVKPFWRALAGLEAGIVAGSVMLVYLMLDAVLRGWGPWSVVNLFASNSYGSAALGSAFRRTSIVGLAWYFFTSGLLGLAISLVLKPFLRRPTRCALVGAVTAVGWYYWGARMLWPLWNPLAGRYQPFPALLIGYLIFGIAMGSYPRFLAQLEEGTRREPAAEPAGGEPAPIPRSESCG